MLRQRVEYLAILTKLVQIEAEGPQCAYLPGSHQGSLWDCHAHCLPCLWPDDQYPGDRHALDWRQCCCKFLDWRSHCCSLLLASCGSRAIHYVSFDFTSLPANAVLTFDRFGGIKATFLTDYVHTVIILVIIFVFAFSAYATNAVAGSPGKIWELLVAASERHPVEGNAGGSYLTMKSREGAIFFVINIVGNFGTVCCLSP
jgi:hypothetical protein